MWNQTKGAQSLFDSSALLTIQSRMFFPMKQLFIQTLTNTNYNIIQRLILRINVSTSTKKNRYQKNLPNYEIIDLIKCKL